MSCITTEILVVLISTVASERVFNTGGKMIDPYKASLALKTICMLMCKGDWIWARHRVKKPTQL